MIYIVMIILLISIIILIIGFDIKISEIKKIKIMSEDESLKQLTSKLPNNVEVCKEMLDIVKNNNVKIEENKDVKTSLYVIMKNKIIIANISNTFTRIQTIAHECIHSIQNKKILKFNYIYSNIYILSFFGILILSILKLINNDIIYIVLYIILSFIYYSIRSFLEDDAMIRAKYLSQEYLSKVNILSKEENDIIIRKYEDLNRIGIKFYNFYLLFESILKIIILTIVMLIFR